MLSKQARLIPTFSHLLLNHPPPLSRLSGFFRFLSISLILAVRPSVRPSIRPFSSDAIAPLQLIFATHLKSPNGGRPGLQTLQRLAKRNMSYDLLFSHRITYVYLRVCTLVPVSLSRLHISIRC